MDRFLFCVDGEKGDMNRKEQQCELFYGDKLYRYHLQTEENSRSGLANIILMLLMPRDTIQYCKSNSLSVDNNYY